MSILLFLAVLFVLILVHEFGHFIAAKKSGMRVDEFAIGFPPRLFSRTKGETTYSINLLPIGGYVKIFGEDAVGTEHSPDEPRAFTAKPRWIQAVVLLAGVTMNVLLAWVLFIIIFTVGVQTAVTPETATDEARLMVTNVLPESPAADAGVAVGTEIVGVSSGEDTLTELSPESFTEFTAEHSDAAITVTYRTGDEEQTALLTSERGLLPEDEDRKILGVGLALIDTIPLPFLTAVKEGTVLTYTTLRDITVGLTRLIVDAVQLKADLSQVAGPIGIVGLVGEASAFGFTSLLMFTAFISLNLAVINILPFPALDGGRLLFVIIESVKGSAIKPQAVAIMNMVGFAILILLMIAVTVHDVLKVV
ncbi:hypothetical protein GW943_00740 [Candidatus Parcubacteria bacterium]|uniref:Peptidase M50 domain-containing protein n=1 Tax=Candidatus Kaiserbacteria bacterium CG10_big_fil_rev_8_21_14_0_10_47_16 TaxID=1974608 RepID=A0A2H0UDA3_9BACT|nr:hypothetical protein [Candidatus Parcubacteria bacterium]PIR84367.1 MAG: hypothetical protein COU16_02125 [Candidatus Kaiserbacteria bacterium CG10_big_fil_rev_8_21_14_0_10_47_16]